jgi:hypothetical protein
VFNFSLLISVFFSGATEPILKGRDKVEGKFALAHAMKAYKDRNSTHSLPQH